MRWPAHWPGVCSPLSRRFCLAICRASLRSIRTAFSAPPPLSRLFSLLRAVSSLLALWFVSCLLLTSFVVSLISFVRTSPSSQLVPGESHSRLFPCLVFGHAVLLLWLFSLDAVAAVLFLLLISCLCSCCRSLICPFFCSVLPRSRFFWVRVGSCCCAVFGVCCLRGAFVAVHSRRRLLRSVVCSVFSRLSAYVCFCLFAGLVFLFLLFLLLFSSLFPLFLFAHWVLFSRDGARISPAVVPSRTCLVLALTVPSLPPRSVIGSPL